MRKNRRLLRSIAFLASMSLLMTGCGIDVPEAQVKESEETTAEAQETEKERPEETEEETKPEDKKTVSSSEDIKTIGSQVDVKYDSYYMDSDSGIDTRLMAQGNFPIVKLGTYENGEFNEYDGKYEGLKSSLKEYNQVVESIYLDNIEQCREYASEDQRFKENTDYLYDYFYEIDMNATVTRSDEVLFSFFETDYIDWGGVHPSTVYKGFNFDSESGKVLHISDLIPDREAFIEAVDKKLHEDYPDIDDALIIDDLKTTLGDMYDEKDGLQVQFHMTHTTLDIIFSAYDLTFYAYGPQFISLTYADYADILNEKYTKTSRNYAAAVTYYTPVILDTADGGTRTLTVSCERPVDPSDDEYNSMDLAISLDGKEYDERIDYAYDVRSYILEKDNKAYLYVSSLLDSDWRFTNVYDLNGETAKKIEEELDYSFYELTPVDTDNFVMKSRSNLLSTYGLFRNYTLGSDGLPVPMTDFWWIDSDLRFTLKSDLTLPVMNTLSTDGSFDGKEETFSKDTFLFPVRTDGEKWVDARTTNGSYVRINVDKSDWPQIVDGRDIEELFDGIVFAG